MSLRKLIEAVEAGTATGGDGAMVVPRDMSDLIVSITGDDDELWSAFVGAHDGSLDDAKALHDALLPGSLWHIGHLDAPSLGYCATVSSGHFADSPSWRGFNIDPARAWLLAILRAMEAEGQP